MIYETNMKGIKQRGERQGEAEQLEPRMKLRDADCVALWPTSVPPLRQCVFRKCGFGVHVRKIDSLINTRHYDTVDEDALQKKMSNLYSGLPCPITFPICGKTHVRRIRQRSSPGTRARSGYNISVPLFSLLLWIALNRISFTVYGITILIFLSVLFI